MRLHKGRQVGTPYLFFAFNKNFYIEIQAENDEDSWLQSPIVDPVLYAFEIDTLGNPVYTQIIDSINVDIDSLLTLPGVSMTSDGLYTQPV